MTFVPFVLALGTTVAVYANRDKAPTPVKVPVKRCR